jgi:selenoprotein W-related protein
LAEEVLKAHEHSIQSLTLIPSKGGKFEVSVNGNLIFSKLQTQRHAAAGEILNLISKLVN